MNGDRDFFANNDDFQFGTPRQPDRNDRLIPMINVVFLLLTFFMIAGTIRTADTLLVEPPEASSKGVVANSYPILYIDEEGEVAFQGERVALEQALSRIKVMLREDGELHLQLKADRHTAAYVILPILRKISALGVKNLQLIAVKRGGGA